MSPLKNSTCLTKHHYKGDIFCAWALLFCELREKGHKKRRNKYEFCTLPHFTMVTMVTMVTLVTMVTMVERRCDREIFTVHITTHKPKRLSKVN